jgi:hypothetical protein
MWKNRRRMAKGGFWDFENYWSTVTSGSFFFDAEWKQRRDINSLEAADQHLQAGVMSVGARLAQTQEQVFHLSMMVYVLSSMLHEAGLLDGQTLQARVDAEIAKVRPPPPPPMVDPWAAKPASPAPAAPVGEPYRDRHETQPTVPCARCGAVVPTSQTTITENGTVCDPCARVP